MSYTVLVLAAVREALRHGDLKTASENAMIYELHPVAIRNGIAQSSAPADAIISRR